MQPAQLEQSITTAAPAPARHGLWYAAGALLAGIGSLLLILHGGLAFPLDDAYITMHNAAMLHAGGPDAAFPGTPALAGATSLLHLALVALLGLLLPLPVATLAWSCAGVVLYVLGLLRLGLVLGLRPWLAAAGALAGALTGFALFNLLNGLETGLAMAGVAWALVFALRPPRPWALPALCGLLPFLRPELGLLSLLLVGREAWLGRLPPPAQWLLPLLLTSLPFLLWSWMNTGHLLPSTIMAKAYFYSQLLAPPGLKLRIIGNALFSSWLGLCMVGFVLWPRDSLAACGALFGAVFIACYGYLLPEALVFNGNRYALLLLPLSTYSLLAAAARDRSGQYLLLAVAALAVALAPRVARTYLDSKEGAVRELAAVSGWLDHNLPPGARLLVHDVGYLAWAGQRGMTDVVGLKTPSAVAWHRQFTYGSGDRGKAFAAIAACAGTTHAVVLQDPDEFWLQLSAGLQANGWQLTLLRQPASPVGYRVYGLAPPASGFTQSCKPV